MFLWWCPTQHKHEEVDPHYDAEETQNNYAE